MDFQNDKNKTDMIFFHLIVHFFSFIYIDLKIERIRF